MKAKAHDDILDKTGKELQEEIIGRVQACQSRLHSERAAVLVSGVGVCRGTRPGRVPAGTCCTAIMRTTVPAPLGPHEVSMKKRIRQGHHPVGGCICLILGQDCPWLGLHLSLALQL